MVLKGIAVSGGIVIGRVLRYLPMKQDDSEKRIAPELAEQEAARYRAAAALVRGQLEALSRQMDKDKQESSKIFLAHIAIVDDEVMNEEIEEAILSSHFDAPSAVSLIYNQYIALLGKTKDDLIRERTGDMKDIKLRLLRALAGEEHMGLSQLDAPVVIVADDLLPSDTATMDRGKVLAMITQVGGATSHSAIIARSYDIPAVLGVAGAMEQLRDGETVVVDAEKGLVLTALSQMELDVYTDLSRKSSEEKRQMQRYRAVQPVTRDGRQIQVELNMENVTPEVLSTRDDVSGVGLFRTEFLYLGRKELPSEQEQFQVYRKAAEAFGEKPVTLRTLDIGGDKQAECLALPQEMNPFLGNRALRLCLAKPDVFLTQLRAALRASAYGDLQIMFPMVSGMEDIYAAKRLLEQAKEQLQKEGLAFRENIPVGIMVEIPSVALIADMAAREVDFASIGSNDLCQYLTAADRLNPQVSRYYRSFHPAMFRLIGAVVEAFHQEGKPVAVCGEMGGDPVSALALLGLGVDALSMGRSAVPYIKRMITSFELEQAQKIARSIQTMSLADDIQNALTDCLHDILSRECEEKMEK